MAVVRVLMAGATGKTGGAVAQELLKAPDVQLVGAVGARSAGQDLGLALGGRELGLTVQADAEQALAACRPDVLVDFTAPDVAARHALLALRHGVRPVIGTTGLSRAEVQEIREAAEASGLAAVLIPNFSFGVLLLSRFAREAARHYGKVEVIEMHHDTKRDAPSGTARRLAEDLEAVRGAPVPVHSVRLPGLVAHHAVLFGGSGETLTIRHDTISRSSFAPGVLLAIRGVARLRGLITSLDELLEAH